MRKLFWLLVITGLMRACGGGQFVFAQSPQSTLAPIVAVNSAYNNGVSPGYRPTAGSGLVLNLGPGTINNLGTIIIYSGGTLTLTASSTNYVYLNHSASYVPAFNTSGFNASDIPIAKVLTASSAITATCSNTGAGSGTYPCVVDDRTPFFVPNTGSAGINQLTGDGMAGPGSGSQVLTFATVNSGPGSCGDATHVCELTTNGKGLVTAQTAVAITPGASIATINVFPGPGTLTSGQEILLIANAFTTNLVIPSSCGNSQGGAQTLSTGTVSFTIIKHAGGPTGSPTTLCSAQFTSSGLIAAFSGAGGSLAPGDYLEIDAPGTADATLANVTLGIYATH